MRMLVIIGVDYKRAIDHQRIADATQEPFRVNTYPPESGGWVFWDWGKGEPDWGWADYNIVVGTVEAGTHEVALHILRSEDVEGALINAYEKYNEETDIGEEGL